MYVYIQSQPGIYTVGFYSPDGKWHPDTDHEDREKAAERVAWLNGGQSPHDSPMRHSYIP